LTFALKKIFECSWSCFTRIFECSWSCFHT
jgi:hypothetical protein